jgi:hypothetical protein
VDKPMTAREDREALGYSVPHYKLMAEGLANQCWLNKHNQLIPIKKMKLKKLKNLRHQIRKHPVKSKSIIHKELVRQINIQIGRKERRPLL